MINISVDMTGLNAVTARLSNIPPQLNAAIPGILNEHGRGMRQRIISQVATDLQLPPGAVASAIIEHLASTGLDPTYLAHAFDSMLPYVRWVTARDEKVCKICGPRDNVVYLREDAIQIYPAHPNCRCRLQAVGLADDVLHVAPPLVRNAANGAAQDIIRLFSGLWGSA
jgi:hypothetical protein